MQVRAGIAADLPNVRCIQELSPEAAQWQLSADEFLVAEHQGALAGFLIWRAAVPEEIEILNLAVHPAYRRLGIARALISSLPGCTVFLEVRESNHAARALYRSAGFRETGVRPGYYQYPPEAAIAMRLEVGIVTGLQS